jgi:signal transduction histidine kinase
MTLPRLHLRAKLLLAFVTVLLPVLVLLWVDFRANLADQEESILGDQLLTAQAIAVQVDEAFDSLCSLGWAVASNPLVHTSDPGLLDARLQQLVLREPQAELIAVYDAEGISRNFQVSPHVSGRSVADERNFRRIMATNIPHISDVLLIDRLNAVGIIAAVPIRDADDRSIGAVMVGVSTVQMANRYEHARQRPGQAIFLIDRAGQLAFHTGSQSITYKESKLPADTEPIRAALSGISTTQARFSSPFGEGEHLAAFVPTPKYHWMVGVMVPRGIALAPIKAAFRTALAAFAGILVISVVLAALLARYLVAPVRRLEEAAQALGKGDLTRRVCIESRDELGRLGDAFNTMATQLTRLYEEQRDTLRMREDFMQAAAHELKTPIATIRSAIHLVLARPHDPQIRRTLEIIRRQATRLTLLAEDLLTVTRLQAGLLELRQQHIDLSMLATETIHRAAELTDKHAITLTSAGPLIVEADPEMLRLALMRLLENAIAASPEGEAIEVSARREGCDALVSVVDHGFGIPVERQPYIFEPFYEAVPSGLRGYVGVVSLRLHICKRILDAHGGRLWFTNAPQRGSTFCFSLPLSSSNNDRS